MSRLKTRVVVVNPAWVTASDEIPQMNSSPFSFISIYEDLALASSSMHKTLPEILVVAISDTSNPDIILTLKKIRRGNPALKILILTDNTNSEYIFELLGIGIEGIGGYDATWEEMIAYLKEMIAGRPPLNAKLSKIILSAFQVNLIPNLSQRQLQIIKLMFLGMTYSSIASRLGVSNDTVRTHIRNLYKRLNVNNKEDALVKAINERVVLIKT